ncbi:unnamed protein product [Hymenolepis diminuta]|uniref:Uncharacterized protein n=1 Tax=Hymenolepis diminuta TaxID=6216 RepID=A0A564Y6Q0_HYMDI|nr:unnamed protein product [Hymenolepis diminuta]
MKLEHAKSRNPQLTDRMKIVRCRSLTQQTYPNRLNNKPRCRFYGSFHFMKIVLFINISARTAIRTGARRDSARAVKDNRM